RAPLFTLTAAEGDGDDDAAEPVADGSVSDGSEDAAAGASGDAASAAAGPAPALTWTALVVAAAGVLLDTVGFVRSRPPAWPIDRPSVLRRVVAVVVGAAAAVLLAILASGPAAAHAVLVGTDPQDGTVLDAPPDALTITFIEPVQAVAGGTTVLAADGSPVDVDVAAVDDALVVTPAATLDDGTYVVSWRVVSLDTHPVAGAFTFSVGAPSATSVE